MPKAEGKPCVIGNCQAGWAVMMLAAIRPELFGPIIVAGSPPGTSGSTNLIRVHRLGEDDHA